MTTAQDVLRVARAEVGYAETPVNRTKYGKWYGMDGNPWCDMWVSWVFAQAGAAPLIGGKFAYCPTHVNWFKKQGRFWGTKPKVGDVVFYGTGGVAAHVGIVEEVHRDHIVAIEGNTSLSNQTNGGSVMRRTRLLGNWIVGFGRPAYAEATPPPVTVIDVEGDLSMVQQVSFTITLGDKGHGYTDLDVPVEKLIGAPVLNASDPGPGGSGYPHGITLSRLKIGDKIRVVATDGPPNSIIGASLTRLP